MKKKILSMLLAVTLLAGGTVFTLGADKADASTRSNFGQICSMFTDTSINTSKTAVSPEARIKNLIQAIRKAVRHKSPAQAIRTIIRDRGNQISRDL